MTSIAFPAVAKKAAATPAPDNRKGLPQTSAEVIAWHRARLETYKSKLLAVCDQWIAHMDTLSPDTGILELDHEGGNIVDQCIHDVAMISPNGD